jgi:hypothetical protein
MSSLCRSGYTELLHCPFGEDTCSVLYFCVSKHYTYTSCGGRLQQPTVTQLRGEYDSAWRVAWQRYATKEKAPMTVLILLCLFKTVNFSLASERAFWCALLLVFVGLLRKSSLIPASKTVPSNKRLNRGDISRLSLSAFFLSCAHSKTNQFGQ